MADSLVATKLLLPWAHRPAVPRPQLVTQLCAARWPAHLALRPGRLRQDLAGTPEPRRVRGGGGLRMIFPADHRAYARMGLYKTFPQAASPLMPYHPDRLIAHCRRCAASLRTWPM